MYKHILIPTDGSELSKKAVDHGIGLAKALNAKVTAVTVSEPFQVASRLAVASRAKTRRPRVLGAVRVLRSARKASSSERDGTAGAPSPRFVISDMLVTPLHFCGTAGPAGVRA